MKWPMVLVLGLIALVLSAILYVLHRDKSRTDFDLTDLVMHNGRLDKFSFWYSMWNGALMLVVFYMVLKDKMSEGILTVILTACVGPLIAKVIWGKHPGASETVVHTEKTVSSSTAKVEP